MLTNHPKQFLFMTVCWCLLILVVLMNCHKTLNGDNTLNRAINIIQQYNYNHQ